MMTTSFDVGTVVHVNSKEYTCTVLLNSGAVLENVRMMNITGGMQQIEVTWLTNFEGASVLVIYIMSHWYIIGSLPMPGDRTKGSKDLATEYDITVSDTSPVQENISFSDLQKSASKATTSKYAFDKYSPTAFLPGDKVISADGGASVGIYRKNLIVAKAASLAQIILGGLTNFIRIIARELSIITDFGEIKSEHADSKKIGIAIKGGATKEECAPDGSGYTLNAYMGTVPGVDDGRYSVKVFDDSDNYAAFTLEKSGTFNLGASKDFNIASHENATINADKNIGFETAGNYKLTTAKNVEQEIAGNMETTCMGKIETMASRQITEASLAGKELRLGGVLKIAASGISFTTSTPGVGAACTISCASMNIVSG